MSPHRLMAPSRHALALGVAIAAACLAFFAGLAMARPATATGLHSRTPSMAQLARPFTTAFPHAPSQSTVVRSRSTDLRSPVISPEARRLARPPFRQVAPVAPGNTRPHFAEAAPVCVILLGLALCVSQWLRPSRRLPAVPHIAFGANIAVFSCTSAKASRCVRPNRGV